MNKKHQNYELSIKWVILFWIIVIAVAFIFGGLEAAGVAASVALISVSIMLFQSRGSWEGEVIDLFTKQVKSSQNEDAYRMSQTAYVARLKLKN